MAAKPWVKARQRIAWYGKRHPIATILVAALVVSVAATAALLIRQDVAVSPQAVAPDVTFAQGPDYAAINSAGFATLSIGSSGTSASLTAAGVPGAALVGLEDVMQIQNQHASQDYSIAVARSADLDAAISGFRIVIEDSSDNVILDWDAAASASSGPFSLPASSTYDVSVYPVIVDGTAAGALSGFDIQFSLAPA